MLATILSAALTFAGAVEGPATLPSGAWASRMIMSFTPDGDLNGCRLENSGALKPAAADGDCLRLAGIRAEPARFAPEATTSLIFEERFVPALVDAAAIETSPGDQLLSRQLVHVRIGPDGKVAQCRALEATGSMPPMNDDPCATLDGGFDVPRGASAPSAGTMILSVYLRSEVIA